MNPDNIWITFPELLIWFPLLAGLVCFFIKSEKSVKSWSLFASFITLIISLLSIYFSADKYQYFNNVGYFWLKYLGSSSADVVITAHPGRPGKKKNVQK